MTATIFFWVVWIAVGYLAYLYDVRVLRGVALKDFLVAVLVSALGPFEPVVFCVYELYLSDYFNKILIRKKRN